MPSTIRPELEIVAPLRLVLLRLARRIRQQAADGLTPSRMSALSTIQRHGPIRLGELGERERIGKSSVTRLAAGLEQAGHIRRVVDPADGRSSLIDLTAQGMDLLAQSNARADAFLARQVAALPAEDLEQIADTLPILERLLDVKA